MRTAIFRSISATYNCVGMVFACRRTHIHPDCIRKILGDDKFQPVTSRSDLGAGDVVLYLCGSQIEHIGIVASISVADGIWVVSKWETRESTCTKLISYRPFLGKRCRILVI